MDGYQRFLAQMFVVLLGIFVAVMVFEGMESFVSRLAGLSDKNETLKFLGIGMGGVLLTLQALMSYKRAKALENIAEAQAKATNEQVKANQNTEQGQRQERLKNAIEHLGHESDSVRLGGAYELFHLAEDTKDLCQTVLDILCAHIRRTTGEARYQEDYQSKPSEEIQSLLTLLFVQDHEIFKGLLINLQGSWLSGAYLAEARLPEATLDGAHLQGATLDGAHLQGTTFDGAHLQGATLDGAHLQGATLDGAHLQGATLDGAYLQGADLHEAQLQGADLREAHLQGADLYEAHLQGANLHKAQFQGATSEDQPVEAFEGRMNEFVNRGSDLSQVISEGGLTREKVESMVEGLSDEYATELRRSLESGINQPIIKGLPEDRGAITGTYTTEEAARWIAEYKEATSAE